MRNNQVGARHGCPLTVKLRGRMTTAESAEGAQCLSA
jgi:hypothetical protein